MFNTGSTMYKIQILGQMEHPNFLYNGAQNVSVGPGFTQSAMDSVFPGFGSYFVAIALFFFAFTTILAYYIAETNISLTRNLNSYL
jgi:AGCS family alanine or glycine:cation symporter